MSLILQNNSINNVTVTLNENTTITGTTFYLWSVTSDDSNTSVEFICPIDLSFNQFRFNQFDITLTSGTTNPTNGTISNLLAGTYKYNIYQQNSNTNLIVANALGLVETGRIVVLGDVYPARVVYNNQNNTKIVYGQ